MQIQPSVFYAESTMQAGCGMGTGHLGVFTHRGIPQDERLLKLVMSTSNLGLHFTDQRTANIFKNTIQFYSCPIEFETSNSESREHVVNLSLSYESYLAVERLIRHIYDCNTFEDERCREAFERTVETFQIFNRSTFQHPTARAQCCTIS